MHIYFQINCKKGRPEGIREPRGEKGRGKKGRGKESKGKRGRKGVKSEKVRGGREWGEGERVFN